MVFHTLFQAAFAQDHNDDFATIKSNRTASNEAITKHDVDGIAKYFLDDFVQVVGRGIYQSGKENVIAFWKELFNSNPQVAYIRNPEEIIISDNDTMAWEQGK